MDERGSLWNAKARKKANEVDCWQECICSFTLFSTLAGNLSRQAICVTFLNLLHIPIILISVSITYTRHITENLNSISKIIHTNRHILLIFSKTCYIERISSYISYWFGYPVVLWKYSLFCLCMDFFLVFKASLSPSTLVNLVIFVPNVYIRKLTSLGCRT